ncbi:ThiF family adenylyltransferase [Candidatus Wolfebacteria bacterium]|nr:ThiF family adenylyltransferase [Candidatus Wolfebacteria bacterium]
MDIKIEKPLFLKNKSRTFSQGINSAEMIGETHPFISTTRLQNIRGKVRDKNKIPRGAKFIDTFDSELKELFKIRYPKFKNNKEKLKEFLKKSQKIKSVYVYFPWNNNVARILPENLFFEIRTARNKNLITKEDQEKFYNAKIGIAGLSIGSNILWPLLISGGGKFLRIADPDTIELTNLNRLFYPISGIGENKTISALRKAYELNPFIKIDPWINGVKLNNLEKFIKGTPKLDILIDELDDLEIKIQMRILAKKHKIPVLMATNLGEKIIIDIERFDIEPKRDIFHGLLGKFDIKEFKNLAPHSPKWIEATRKILNKELFSQNLTASLKEIGQTLAGAPQLGITSLISSSIIALTIAKIASSKKIKSGRYVIDLKI